MNRLHYFVSGFIVREEMEVGFMKALITLLRMACLSLVAISVLAACSTGESSTDEIDGEAELEPGQKELRVAWWGSQARHERTLAAIELFEEKKS